MPESGNERGRNSTRTMVAAILAGTGWAPADDPQDAALTAREARDLAVRLRPVLSKLAQQPRTGRRKDLDWLPAVEQLAVDAQYFASWWLPRLEGKSASSWPSWSADGYADWVNRLDAQRQRTLEMVRGNAPAVKAVASVTPLAEDEDAETVSEPRPDGRGGRRTERPGTEAQAESTGAGAKVTPIRPVPEQLPRSDGPIGAPQDADSAVRLGPQREPRTAPDTEARTPKRPDKRWEKRADVLVEPVDERPAPPASSAVTAPVTRRPIPKATVAPTLPPLAGAPKTASATPPPPEDDDFPLRMTPQGDPADVGRIVRYALAAVLFIAGAILVAVAVTNKQGSGAAVGATKNPTTAGAASQAPVTGAVQPSGDPASSAATTNAVTAPATTAARTTTKASQGSQDTTTTGATKPVGSTTTAAQPGGGSGGGAGGITSLGITQPSPDQPGSFTFHSVVHVTTGGTGQVTIEVTLAGSNTSGVPGSIGASTRSYTESGKTSYDIPLSFDTHGDCPAQYVGVRVTTSSGGASSAYQDASSSC